MSGKKLKEMRKLKLSAEEAKDGARPRPQILHRRKFMDGRMSPDDVHAALGVNKPCKGCGRPGVVVIRSLCTKKDFLEKANAQWQALVVLGNGGKLPTFKTKYGEMLVIAEVASCRMCQPAAERAAAKHPDWILIEINRGPKQMPIQVGYGTTPSSVH